MREWTRQWTGQGAALRTSLAVVVASVSLSGCGLLVGSSCLIDCGSRTTNASSLVDFLYPQGEVPAANDAIPELRIPLRVGLTFLPSTGGAQDVVTKAEVLERVRQRFLSRKFIAEIVVIPDYYLTSSKDSNGFDTLQGLQRLYNLDLVALVSHDQVTHTDDNALSLTYLTIVGAYIFPGSRHEVTTLVDLAVVDPATRSLLLRAGGTDSQSRSTTLVDQDVTTRGTQAKGMVRAGDQMIEHFDLALTQFEENVRNGTARVKVSKRERSSIGGGGSLGYAWTVAGTLLLAARWRRRRPNQ